MLRGLSNVGARLTHPQPSIMESIFSRISNTLIKVSLLTFYLRIFNPVPRLKFMIWFGLVVVVALSIGIIIGTLILCHPLLGELPLPSRLTYAPCNTGLTRLTTAGNIFNVVSDFYIFLIPVHILPSLKLSRRRKAAVGSVFLIGFL